MSTTTTALMGMILPIPSSEPGPAWASEVVTAMNVIDVHDHSSGKGARVTANGLNINSDLSIGSNNLTFVRTVRLTSQGSTLGGGAEVRELYSVNDDLYYNNGSGAPVKITAGNTLNVAAGANGIGGDYGTGGNPASVFFTDATDLYSFTTDPGVFANLKFRGLELTGKIVLNPSTLAGALVIGTNAADANQLVLVDTSAARSVTLPNPTTEKRFVIFKDKTNTAATNNITISPNAAETIDGVSGNKVMSANGGFLALVSDGTNWFSVFDKEVDVAQFDGTSGAVTVSTSYASLTISSTSFTLGTAITRSSNVISFTKTGNYKVVVMYGDIVDTTPVTSNIGTRFRDTTSATTLSVGVIGAAGTSAGNSARPLISMTMFVTIANTAHTYEIQTIASGSNTSVNGGTISGENFPAFRFILQYLGR